jgi:hypothetical protein
MPNSIAKREFQREREREREERGVGFTEGNLFLVDITDL